VSKIQTQSSGQSVVSLQPVVPLDEVLVEVEVLVELLVVEPPLPPTGSTMVLPPQPSHSDRRNVPKINPCRATTHP